MVGLLERLVQHRLVAIVRGEDPQNVEAACRVLLDAGVKLLEVPLTTPRAADVISRLASEVDEDVWIGAGTVLTTLEVGDVAAAGGKFIVTPALSEAVDAAIMSRIPVLAGAYTPTEILQAHTAGAAAVKLFPAGPAGCDYFKALRDPFPNIPLVPVGGVDLAKAREYLRLGAVAVGVGGPLVGDATKGGSLDELRVRARDFLAGLA